MLVVMMTLSRCLRSGMRCPRPLLMIDRGIVGLFKDELALRRHAGDPWDNLDDDG